MTPQVPNRTGTDPVSPCTLSLSGCGDFVCDACAALLNDVDEYAHKLRTAEQRIRDKYKLATLSDGDASIVHQMAPSAG